MQDSLFYILEIFIFLLGFCIGSFLNCVIYRIEEDKSFLKGRSFCPNCKHKLNWLDLFPVFSFLLLGGKCRYCKIKISWQYLFVEIFTAVVFLLIFSKVGVIPNLTGNPRFAQVLWIPAFAGMTTNLLFLFYIASSLIVISVYDLKHYLIPDNVLLPAVIISLLYKVAVNFSLDYVLNLFLAVLISSGFFFILWLVSGGKWMGFGDVKLAILLGILLGWPNILVALFLAFFLGAIVGVALLIFKKTKMKSEIAFGPFLILGTFLAMFWGQNIINWYLNLVLF